MVTNINRDQTELWDADIRTSVEMYNDWFLNVAPEVFRSSREGVIREIAALFDSTRNMTELTAKVIWENPDILATLRMTTAPPLARDRLVGLADVRKSLVKTLEEGNLPVRMPSDVFEASLVRIIDVIFQLLDRSLFDWVDSYRRPSREQVERAMVVVGDRRCSALSDPIIRNGQEARQLSALKNWLDGRGYIEKWYPSRMRPQEMESGTYSIHRNVPILNEVGRMVGMPIDLVIQPHDLHSDRMPILIEAKSAGDYTNTNKRRKEEATKSRQLKETYGNGVKLILLLCGYFDRGYLEYEAAEGLDWIWEHRIGDLSLAGV